MYIYHIFIHSSIDGHSGYLCILVIVNNVAMNIGVHVSFPFSVLILEIYPGREFPDSMVVLVSIFWRNLHTVFHVNVPIYII